MCLVPDKVGEGENPRLACWHGVLVDKTWRTLNRLGSWMDRGGKVPGQVTCQELGTLESRQSSRPAQHPTGSLDFRRLSRGTQALPGARDCGLLEQGVRGCVRGRTTEGVYCRWRRTFKGLPLTRILYLQVSKAAETEQFRGRKLEDLLAPFCGISFKWLTANVIPKAF